MGNTHDFIIRQLITMFSNRINYHFHQSGPDNHNGVLTGANNQSLMLGKLQQIIDDGRIYLNEPFIVSGSKHLGPTPKRVERILGEMKFQMDKFVVESRRGKNSLRKRLYFGSNKRTIGGVTQRTDIIFSLAIFAYYDFLISNRPTLAPIVTPISSKTLFGTMFD